MRAPNCLGIYLSKEAATVVCLGGGGRDRKILGCFSVAVEKQQGADLSGINLPSDELAVLIARGCTERGLSFSEVAVALDCVMFMQHNVHSEFVDPKQIAQTIRFDTEESLSTDIADVALSFKITSSDQTGSELNVFTAQKKILSEVLLSLQNNNIDPVTIEPDVNCLSRFVCQGEFSENLHSLFALISCQRGYFIAPQPRTGGELQLSSIDRAFLIGSTQNRGKLFAREVPITIALLESGESVNCLKVFDSSDSIDCQQLSEKLGIRTEFIDLAEFAGADADVLADCTNLVDFAIAYGAALANLEKIQSINFRNDFSPFQGRKIRLQKVLKLVSVSVVILLLAAGLHVQARLLQENGNRTRLRSKLESQYSAVMFGNRISPKSNAAKKLASELRRIRNVKSGQLSTKGEKSVAAKLTLVLEAFNKCANKTDLKIDSVSVTTKAISVTGNTSSRRNTLKLFEAINKKLEVLQQRLDSKGGRDNFRITVTAKK